MRFTLLIAHYNSGVYFKECYNSICKQTDNDFKIIILDDASTDGSLELVKNLTAQDSRVQIHKNESNKSVGFTKKQLAELAVTEICAFLDPDDALAANAIELTKKAYRDNREIVATYSKFYVCDEDLKPQKLFEHTRGIPHSNKLFFNIHFEIAHFFSFKKEAYIAAGGIDEGLKSAEDQDLYLKLYDYGKIYFIDAPLYLYRIHKKSLTHDPGKTNQSNSNWHAMLMKTAERRGFKKLYGQALADIENLPELIFRKENTLFDRLRRKIL